MNPLPTLDPPSSEVAYSVEREHLTLLEPPLPTPAAPEGHAPCRERLVSFRKQESPPALVPSYSLSLLSDADARNPFKKEVIPQLEESVETF